MNETVGWAIARGVLISHRFLVTVTRPMGEGTMSDFVALLGVRGGPAVRPGSHMPTSNLVVMNDLTIVLDAGVGVIRGICDQGVRLIDIDVILISHLHSDHYAELGPLIHTAWTTGLTRPLTVYGPKVLADYWHHFQQAMMADTALRVEDEGRVDLATLITIVEIEEGEVFTQKGVTVTALRNHHPPIKHSYAFRFDTAEKRLVVSGDTTFIPEMIPFAQNADVLVHESMLTEGVEAIVNRNPNGDDRLRQHILRSHTTAQDAGRIATEAGVKRLALTHLVPDDLPEFTHADWIAATRQTWDGPLDIGIDGLKIEF